MINFKKGFAIQILIIVIAMLAVGGGAYVYNQKKLVPSSELSVETVISTTTVTTKATSTQSTFEVSTTSSGPDHTQCFENSKYYIISKQGNTLGAETVVKFKDGNKKVYTCLYFVEDGDFEFIEDRNDDFGGSWYVNGLVGDKLIFDGGTGFSRWIGIYDLKTKKLVYEGGSDGHAEIRNNTLQMRNPTEEKVSEENCSTYIHNESFTYDQLFISGKYTLDLDTFKYTGPTEKSCAFNE